MTVVLHTLDSADARKAFLAARANLRGFIERPGTLYVVGEALRDDSLSALTGRAPLAPVRHLPSMSAKVRRIAADVQGADVSEALCPILAADGVSATDAQALRIRNGKQQGADMRATSERCPFCLAADVIRTLTREGEEARDAALRWNTRSK